MLNGFSRTAKTTSISLPVLFYQIVLSEGESSFVVPQKDFNLKWQPQFPEETSCSYSASIRSLAHCTWLWQKKTELLSGFHSQISPASVKFTLTSKTTTSNNILSLSPTKALLKEMLSGVWAYHTGHSLIFLSCNVVQCWELIHQRFSAKPPILPKPYLFSIFHLEFPSWKKMIFGLH